MYRICSLADCPELSPEVAACVHEHWPAVEHVVQPVLPKSLHPADRLPLTFVLRDETGGVAGFYQLLERETVTRQELSPWISPLFVHPAHRGRALGERLLRHARRTAGGLGFPNVYLATDHIGYYERYGFEEIGLDVFPSGRLTKLYRHTTILDES